MVRHFVHAAAVAAVALSPAAGFAQASFIPSVIGSTVGNMVAAGKEHDCMMGIAPMASRTDAARIAAGATLRDYLARGATGGDVTPAFTRKAKLRTLLVDGAPLSTAAAADPLARALAGRALGDPATFVRAGDGGSVLGVWTVPAADAGAGPLGHYRGLFRKEGESWKLTRLEAVTGAADPAPATQFCHKPGDVEPYKIIVAEREAERERKRAAKAARRAAEAEARASN